MANARITVSEAPLTQLRKQPQRRWLVLSKRIETWSLTSLQQRLVKTGGRLVKHACFYWLLLAESHLARRLFGSVLRRILALPLPTGQARQEVETNLDD
jgi:hypothetical protein